MAIVSYDHGMKSVVFAAAAVATVLATVAGFVLTCRAQDRGSSLKPAFVAVLLAVAALAVTSAASTS